MTYEKLTIQYDNVTIKEMDFSHVDPEGDLNGLCVNDKIFIRSNLTDTEKKCILAEELGHYHTTVGNILDQSDIRNRKQERRARKWGYEKLVSLNNFIEASKNGIRNKFELAEYLGITEEYLEEVIKFYKEKFGLYYQIDNYIIYFEPLGVYENFFSQL